MSESLERNTLVPFLKDLTGLCARHGIQIEHHRDSMLIRPLDRSTTAGYGARFGFSAGWRLELVSKDMLTQEGVMPREFVGFD